MDSTNEIENPPSRNAGFLKCMFGPALGWSGPSAEECRAPPCSAATMAATPASGELTFMPIVPACPHSERGGGDVNGGALR
jgi:hypothetical protein